MIEEEDEVIMGVDPIPESIHESKSVYQERIYDSPTLPSPQ